MKKKLVFTVVLLWLFINPFSFTFAKTKVIYEIAENLAVQYIENSLEDDSWKNNNPRISWEWKYFYTDDEKNPSYIEFKISCDKTPDCWFIFVNTDWDDVAVPIASTTWNWPSEALIWQNIWNNENNKLYYFSPFEQYAENLETSEIVSINPMDNVDWILEQDVKLTKEEKIEKKKNFNSKLIDRVKKAKIDAKNYKKSDDFKKSKEKIKDQILSVPEEKFVMNNLNVANAAYTNPWTSNVFVPTSDLQSYATCSWRTPCYKQFQTTYNWATCSSWCSPTAVWILFWYYDKNWFWNLLYWTAPVTNTTITNDMIKTIWLLIWTHCNWNTWDTNPENVKNAKQYAINKWYKNTTSSFSNSITTANVFTNVKTEINAGRPIVIHAKDPWHAIVWFWYLNSTTLKVVRMNMWWWGTNNLPIWTIKYYTSNIDQNLDSIYYFDNIAWKTAYATTKFNIVN